MTDRRTVVRGIAGSLPLTALGSAVADESPTAGRDYFGELGLKPFINAAGAYSAFGGARMHPEVIDAMRYAAANKVKIAELHDAVGSRIAALTGAEAAMVTSGATAAIVLATAACMTLGDEERMRRLPDATGMRNEVIIQKRHRYTYDRALTVPGATLVEVESEDDVRRAVGERTAMMFFLLPTQQGDDIPSDRYRALAKGLGVPVLCDAATTTPPAMNVVDVVGQGFDLICYSGGKGLRGPYSAGLLLGRRDLVDFARRHGAPNDLSIGRGMKVSAEEYLGMLVALETGLVISEADDFAWKRKRFEKIAAAISDIPGVTTRVFVAEGHANELYLEVDWDAKRIGLTREQFVRQLRDHDPSVEVRNFRFSGGSIHVSATVMDEGEDVIVGRVFRSILSAHA